MPNLKEIIGEEAFKALPEDTRNKYKDTDFVNSADYVPKERFSQVTTEKNDYKQQLADRDKQLTDLQGKVKDNEALTQEIEKLKAANSTTAADYEKKLQEIQYESAINNALKDSKAKDINLIKALLDKNKLKVNGEEVVGIKEQLEAIKKDKDYLFEKEVPGTGSFNTGAKKNPDGGEVKSLGERLAKEKAEQVKSSEEINKFFK
ncbi:phage scaffolding protein [Clostridium swellfunianum]|uniref:phage scaffolding protein n=1 Tax=Clostridium swellfunianum TaxID=1367462 RepID=UPI00202EB8C1|nr:phage scaffolding protein [Clostridium swellfunianum]MCM0648640.1 phage scaffolding protein [Clostridium swellfunianum]